MKLTATLFLLAFLSWTTINAQECVLPPAMEQEAAGSAGTSSDFCFDVDYVQENCITVYIGVNVHFFLDDNCEGQVATHPNVTENLNVSNAFQLADDYISSANDFFETMSQNTQGLNNQWNASDHGAVETEAQCIPIRYVLQGVYTHCDTDAQNTGINFNDFNEFEENGGSEINIYVSNVLGTATGFASPSNNNAVVENLNPGLLNHELGHAFGLSHTQDGGDGCDDVWDYNWSWDANGDGEADESDDVCWNNEPTFNGLDACDTELFVTEHPCCDWDNQNNNLMTYSGWAGNPNYSALTPCQITELLTDISENMCDYVIGVGCCPPPAANIGELPTVYEGTDCPTCFYMNGSFDECLYTIQVVNDFGDEVANTGEIFTTVEKYCIYPKTNKYGQPYWPNGFQTGETYTVILTVYNECGDMDTDEVTFTLPPPCNIQAEEPDDIEVIGFSPNPVTSYAHLNYTTQVPGRLKIYGQHYATGTYYGVIYDQYVPAAPDQILQLNLQSWQNGMNGLIIDFEGELQVENFIKQNTD